MLKFSPLMLLLTIFASGCASLQQTQPLPPSCQAPPQLPALKPLPPSLLEQSFLSELETVLWGLPKEQSKPDLNLLPAAESTNQRGLGLKR